MNTGRNKINENLKVSLTLGQLRKLIFESVLHQDGFEVDGGVLIRYSGDDFDVVVPSEVFALSDKAFSH